MYVVISSPGLYLLDIIVYDSPNNTNIIIHVKNIMYKIISEGETNTRRLGVSEIILFTTGHDII